MPQWRNAQNSFKVSAYVDWETEAQCEDHRDAIWQGKKQNPIFLVPRNQS